MKDLSQVKLGTSFTSDIGTVDLFIVLTNLETKINTTELKSLFLGH
jgi:hypothetical protein